MADQGGYLRTRASGLVGERKGGRAGREGRKRQRGQKEVGGASIVPRHLQQQLVRGGYTSS